MAKYFFDTEFHEGVNKPFFEKRRNFIELISIGIVSEDGREYYAISKDFDVKAAWNAWQPKTGHAGLMNFKEYWLRENVLRKIHQDLVTNRYNDFGKRFFPEFQEFNFKNFEFMIKSYGKTNATIANQIVEFIYGDGFGYDIDMSPLGAARAYSISDSSLNPEFYAYYADYDWVVFCQALFGKMIDLPKGFPMYCRDLKQMVDERAVKTDVSAAIKGVNSFSEKLDFFKKHPNYPKEVNEHNALADAKWNLELFNFLKSI